MTKAIAYLIAIAVTLASTPAASMANTSFRCGSDLVQNGDTMHEIRSACGSPLSETAIGERKKYRIHKKQRLKLESIVYLTEWIYEKSDGIYILTFEGSRLVRKEFKR